MARITSMFVLLIFSFFANAEQEADHEIHEELRILLHGIEAAINSENYSELAQYFHENLRVTTINQEVILKRSDIESYFDKWFGENGYLDKLDIKLTPDALTELYDNKSFGVVIGSGDEKYLLADGRYFEMKTRWTATVIKDTDEKWRILSLHIGTDFLDNPILTVAENSAKYFGIGGFLLGLFISIIAVFIRKNFSIGQ